MRQELTLEGVHEVVNGVHVERQSFLVPLIVVSISRLLHQFNRFLRVWEGEEGGKEREKEWKGRGEKGREETEIDGEEGGKRARKEVKKKRMERKQITK